MTVACCRAGDQVVITSRTILGARAMAASLQAEVGAGVRVQARNRPYYHHSHRLKYAAEQFIGVCLRVR